VRQSGGELAAHGRLTTIRACWRAKGLEALAQTTALLGRPPTSYEAYVRDVVSRSKAPASALNAG
jgi:hypothetical protein